MLSSSILTMCYPKNGYMVSVLALVTLICYYQICKLMEGGMTMSTNEVSRTLL